MAIDVHGQSHILTVSVEEYYHAGALQGAVRRKHWDRFESRLERSIDELLLLLERHGNHATFFVLGCIADHHPELIRKIVDGGHEIAASGYWPNGLRGALRGQFREDLRRSRDALESAGGARVVGYRAPREWLTRDDLWVLDVLAEEGFLYDSSINPVLHRFKTGAAPIDVAWRAHSGGRGGVWEFPITTVGLFGWRIAVSGGNYMRQLPHSILKRVVGHLDRTREKPLVFYVMPWEIDQDQPHVTSVGTMTRVRLYRNLGKTRWVLEDYFARYRFQSIALYLALPASAPIPADRAVAAAVISPIAASATGPVQSVSLVVPLYNEEKNVGYLYRTLVEFRQQLSSGFHVHVVLVDDGSSDSTWVELETRFRDFADCTLIRHPHNQGVAAAMLTGIGQAPTEIVCTIDADCSYDPHDLGAMIPLIENADIVSASPYHPDGKVLNVPGWRLVLSKTLSRMYGVVLGSQLYTYTACCRIYRKSAIEGLTISNGGFLGIAQILIEAKLRGARIVEFPATLESRLFGESKMKILRTIGGHLGLIKDLIVRRARTRGKAGG